MADVSIIIPVYNSSPHLNQCIDSVLNQTFTNTEIIFVDDGSADNSVEIIEGYIKKDARIKLFRQSNQFAGAARNNGLDHATGKYILFLDSDDFFVPKLVEDAYRAAEKYDADIVMFGHWEYNSINKRKRPIPFSKVPSGCFSANDTADILWYIPGHPWNKFFRRSFIDEHNLRFQILRKSNDIFFTKTAVSLADRMVYIKKRYVYYRKNNPNSLQGNLNIGRECAVYSRTALKNSLTENGVSDKILKSYYREARRALERYGTLDLSDKETYRSYYDTVKENLIPNLFDSEDNFKASRFLTDVYKSESYEDFLFRRFTSLTYDIQYNYISRSNKTYRLVSGTASFFKRLKQHLTNR